MPGVPRPWAPDNNTTTSRRRRRRRSFWQSASLKCSQIRRTHDETTTAIQLHYITRPPLYTTPLHSARAQPNSPSSVATIYCAIQANLRLMHKAIAAASPSPSRLGEGKKDPELGGSRGSQPAIPLFCGLAPPVASSVGRGRSRSVVHFGLEKRFSLFSLPSARSPPVPPSPPSLGNPPVLSLHPHFTASLYLMSCNRVRVTILSSARSLPPRPALDFSVHVPPFFAPLPLESFLSPDTTFARRQPRPRVQTESPFVSGRASGDAFSFEHRRE